MATTIAQPPFTPIEPVIDVLHGIEVVDPYRWLEDQDSVRTRQWLEAQNKYTRSYFEKLRYREEIKARITKLVSVGVVSEVWSIADRYFYLKQQEGEQQPAIVMRNELLGQDQVLLNPLLRGFEANISVGIVAISDDGRFLAYSIRRGGADHCSVEILDTVTREVLRDYLPEGFCNGLIFAPDGSGYYYSHRRLNEPHPNYRGVLWHLFGTEPAFDQEIFFPGEEPGMFVTILKSKRCEPLVYTVFYTGKHRRSSVYVHFTKAGSEPELLVKDIKGFFIPFFASDHLLACTDLFAQNRRIVRIDFDNPAPENWSDVVPELDRRIQQFTVVGPLVFVTRVDRFSTSVERFEVAGTGMGNTLFRSHGTIGFLNRTNGGNKLFLSYSSISEPSVVYCHDINNGRSTVWKKQTIRLSSRVLAEETSFCSKDGTSIPLLVAMKCDLRDSGPLPTFLTAYGGFGHCVTPRFTAFAAFLIEQGFLFAVPALRGGSELGDQWHSAGKRDKRQNSFEDFIAAAKWLIATGRSAADQIAIGGGSNAGLLVGAAITQRPDLFRAAICLGPLLDMCRYHLFNFASCWEEEYGSPQDEHDFKSLMAYSPYHRVQDHISYPAVMMISGDCDTRCNPMHTRKMTARLQAATSSPHPILLDYSSTWGHMPVQSLDRRIDSLTNRLGFLCHELNIRVHVESGS